MTRIQLRVYVDPGQAEVICTLRLKDQNYERLTAVLDTGASVSLFPDDLLDRIEYRTDQNATITIEQAGIARQSFQAIEGLITIILEDQFGNTTQPFETPVWFAKTRTPLIGFAGILDRSILYIDMPQRAGWLEIDP
jgi:hypothetical protein